MMISSKNHIDLNVIILGITIFYIGSLFHDFIFIDAKWTRIISLFGLVSLAYGLFMIPKSLEGVDSYIRYVITIYFLICVVYIVLGTMALLYEGRFNEVLFHRERIWMFLISIVLFLPISHRDMKALLNWAIFYVWMSLLFSLYCFDDFFRHPEDLLNSMNGYETFIVDRPQQPVIMMLPIAFFFSKFKKLKLRIKILVIVAFILALGASLLAGRRSNSLTLVGYALIPILVSCWRNKMKFLPYLLLIASIFATIFISKWGSITNTFETTFPILSERLVLDSRSGTEGDFYKDMNSYSDWIFGRGVQGTYKSTAVMHLDKLNRTLIETGFLNIILHGGLITLVPYMIILCYAFVMGFFYSSNYFINCAAICVFFNILLLYPTGTPHLSYDNFLLFVYVKICIQSKCRLIDYKEIVLLFILKFRKLYANNDNNSILQFK